MRRSVSLAVIALLASACTARPDGAGSEPERGTTGQVRTDQDDSILHAGTPRAAQWVPGTKAPGTSPEVVGSAAPRANLGPPQPGLYRYRLSGSPDTGQDLWVYPARAAGEGWIQRSQWLAAGGDGSGDVIRATRSWTGRGVRILRATERTHQREGSCRYRPPLTELRFPLRVGEQWEGASRCGGRISNEMKILRREQVSIAGLPVSTFVIRWESTREGERTVRLEWFSPDHGVGVRYVYKVKDGRKSGTVVDLAGVTPDPLPPPPPSHD